MMWDICNYIGWLSDDHPINEEVSELWVSGSKFELPDRFLRLEPLENLINLKILKCSWCTITSLEPMRNLINLEVICCDHNEIKSLEPIKNLINLKVLDCTFNKIQSLEPIKNLSNLEKLYCGENLIQSLEPVNNLINLDTIACHFNEIISLDPIEKLINLEIFYCYHNKIISLKPINNLTKLTLVSCSYNQIRSLGPINNLINLETFYYSNNPIEYIPPDIVRRLDIIKNNQNIYNDSQSVHNHNIQESIRKSIQNILNIKPIITDLHNFILNDDILTSKTKEILFDYIDCKDIHSTLNITFEELLLHVINRIEKSDHKPEIKSVLNVEMLDSECKCFTGRISRLINCLNGFDELVEINISENEQIGQIISLVKDQLILKGKYTIENHKSIVKEELLNRKYSLEIINEWINFIE